MRPRFNGLETVAAYAITHRFTLEQAGEAYALMATVNAGKL